MKLLIDADIVTFRGAFSAEEETEAFIACSRTEGILHDIIQTLGSEDLELWLSGDNNFRYGVFPEYKANRITSKRPKWEHEVKDFLVRVWNSNISKSCEADDMLGVRCMELGDQAIICTIDKDLDMIPGWHYNFVKKEKYYVTPEEAIRFFYYQCLIGDTADGIKGVPGIGPVKAKRILDSCEEEAVREGTDVELLYYWAVRDHFTSYEEFEMTAKCLWIWREMGGVWNDHRKAMDSCPEKGVYYSCSQERKSEMAS